VRQKRAIATQISLGVAGVRSVHVVPFSFPSDVACLVTTKQALKFVRWRRIAWNLQDWGTHCSMQLLVQCELSVHVNAMATDAWRYSYDSYLALSWSHRASYRLVPQTCITLRVYSVINQGVSRLRCKQEALRRFCSYALIKPRHHRTHPSV